MRLNKLVFKDLHWFNKYRYNVPIVVEPFVDGRKCIKYKNRANRTISHINDGIKRYFIGNQYIFST
jgi:hypothetical protein